MKAAYIRDGQFGTGTFDDPVPGKGRRWGVSTTVRVCAHQVRPRTDPPASNDCDWPETTLDDTAHNKQQAWFRTA